MNAVLFKPAPYADPDRIVSVYQDSDAGDPTSSSFPATRDMAAYTDVFSGVAAASGSTITWEAADGPRQALVEYVTASYLPVFGMDTSLGRWFEPAFDRVGAGNYAVVSHRTWVLLRTQKQISQLLCFSGSYTLQIPGERSRASLRRTGYF